MTEGRCSLCGGRGRHFNNTCPDCGGSGIDAGTAAHADEFDADLFASSALYRAVVREKGKSGIGSSLDDYRVLAGMER